VKELLVDQCNLKEYQHEQDRAHKAMTTKLEGKLVATNASTSNVAATLKGRVTQLANALVNKKEKAKHIKKTSKINLTQLKDNTKIAIEHKDNKIRDMAEIYISDKDIAVERVRGQGRKRANLPQE